MSRAPAGETILAMPRLSKTNKTFRLDAEIAELITAAARSARATEAEIVSTCVRAQIEPAMRQLLQRRLLTRHPEVVRALAALPTRRAKPRPGS